MLPAVELIEIAVRPKRPLLSPARCRLAVEFCRGKKDERFKRTPEILASQYSFDPEFVVGMGWGVHWLEHFASSAPQSDLSRAFAPWLLDGSAGINLRFCHLDLHLRHSNGQA